MATYSTIDFVAAQGSPGVSEGCRDAKSDGRNDKWWARACVQDATLCDN